MSATVAVGGVPVADDRGFLGSVLPTQTAAAVYLSALAEMTTVGGHHE
jgi:hypothetical protein